MSNGIYYTMGLKTGGFTGPLSAAQSALGSFGGGIAGLAAKVAALAGAAGGIAGAFMALKRASREAADMEGMRVSFEVILGSAEKAKARLADLAAFAAATPFELPEIVTASRTLETLTKGALSTGAGLTLVGDIAAGVQVPFGELAVTVGRLYDGIMSGRPVGEAAMRLQELGAISGATRGKLESMQEAGRSGAEIWSMVTAELGRFGGMMDKQSKTFNGMLSTLRDNISALFRTLGEPLNDFLRPMLADAIDFTSRLGAGLSAVIRLMTAARAQGKLSELLGEGLVLAAQEMINTLSGGFRKITAWFGAAMSSMMASARESFLDERIAIFFESIFKAAGEYLKAAVLSAYATVMDAPEFEGAAAAERQRAGNRLQTALGAMAVDPAAAAKGAIDAITKAGKAGNAAAAAADSSPLIDTAARRSAFMRLAESLDKEAAAALREALGGEGNAVAKAIEEGGKKIQTAATGFANLIDPSKLKVWQPAGGGGADAGPNGRLKKLNFAQSAIARAARHNLSLEEHLAGSSSERAGLSRYLRSQGYLNGVALKDISPENLADYARRVAGEGKKATVNPNARPAGGNPRAKTENTLSKVETLLRDIRDRFDNLAIA